MEEWLNDLSRGTTRPDQGGCDRAMCKCANKYVQISNSVHVPGSQLVNYNYNYTCNN